MAKKDDVWVMVGRYSGLALLLPASVFTGYVIGYLLDKAFGTSFLRIVLLIAGIAGGLLQLIRELAKESRKDTGA
jgi:F0F1-type ATP synthase assembly protein I